MSGAGGAAEPVVRVDHIRMAGLCLAGARQWFAAHGLDWRDFLSRGLPASRLEALHDGLADRVVAVARAEAARHG